MGAKLGPGLSTKVPGGVIYMRRRVPLDVAPILGRSWLKKSSGTTDPKEAALERDHWFGLLEKEFAALRQRGRGPVATAEEAFAAIERWRRAECEAAAGVRAPVHLVLKAGAGEALRAVRALPGRPGSRALDLSAPVNVRAEIGAGAVAEAHAYFAAHPEAERVTSMPFNVHRLLDRLDAASREAEGWRRIEGFDGLLEAAVRAGGLESSLPPSVVEAARQPYAKAALEVTQHQEAERARAAAILEAVEKAALSPSEIKPAWAPDAYTPRAGDLTVREVIAEGRKEKAQELIQKGKAPETVEPYIEKNYGPVFSALEELLGPDKPARVAFSRAKVKEVRDLILKLPANGKKIYPGKSLREMADLAEREGKRLLSPVTRNNYLIHLSALAKVAVAEGWLDKNEVSDFKAKAPANVRRRGWREDELKGLFAALESERGSDRWWVVAILAFSGARANEICQLLVQDVKEVDGLPYIDLSRFDADGQAREDKGLKTPDSERPIPIHPELVAAGFIAFVERARREGRERLFPSFRRHKSGTYTHDLSKWFGRLRRRIGYTAASTVLHSFRHGLQEAGERARLPERTLDALGGWASGGGKASRGYGARIVADLTEASALIQFGTFRLAEAETKPLAKAA